MNKYKNLILKASRDLGSKLVKLDYISTDQLNKGYQVLIDNLENTSFTGNLLYILIYKLQVINENKLLKASVYPLIDLKCFEVVNPATFDIDLDLCIATSTVPFDREDDYILLASAYTMSENVIEEWTKTIKCKIIWYTTNTESISYVFDSLEKEKAHSE